MSIFQLLLIVAVLSVTLFSLKFLRSERLLALKRILALCCVAAGVFAILFPEAVTELAHFFGIGRGTDLLLYLTIVALLVFAGSVIRAKARSDARVTDLARAVALLDARLSEQCGTLSDAVMGHAPASAEATTHENPPAL